MTLSESELSRLGLPLDIFTKPCFETCPTTVTEPTLSMREREITDGIVTELVMQWYGESDAMKGDFQFHFPLNVREDNFYRRPESFRVPFVGPAREWPDPEAAQSIADSVCKGNLDGIVVYVISGNVGVEASDGSTQPAGFAFNLNILLADPNVGVIKPKTFKNMDIVAEETVKLNSKGKYG